MEFASGVIFSYLLVFLFVGSNASEIGKDKTLTACYIEELPNEIELQLLYDLQYCDHIIVYIQPIMFSTTRCKKFVESFDNLRKTNPNLKILVKITIQAWKDKFNIQDTLNDTKLAMNDFDGIGLYFIDKPSDFSDEWKSQSSILFETYREKGKLVTLFLYDCDFENINNVYYRLKVDYMYVICDIDNSFNKYENQEDVAVGTVRKFIDSGISREQIVIAINFCPIKAIPRGFISIEVGKHDEVCKLFMADHSAENITTNEIINMYEWGNGDLKSQILFNSPETVANRVIQAKDLGLAGVMAYRLECDNTEPICLNKVGRYQLFNALRKTEEKEAFDYWDYNH